MLTNTILTKKFVNHAVNFRLNLSFDIKEKKSISYANVDKVFK
jgi:hypothetical protein